MMRNVTSYIKYITLCLALLTSACAEIIVTKVNYARPLEIPHDAHPRPIEFRKLRTLLPPGTEIGLESAAAGLFGYFCSWRANPVNRRILNGTFEMQYLENAFETALESQGYDVTNAITIDFDAQDERARSEYFISAKVIDVDLDLCRRGHFTGLNIFNSANSAKGKIYAQFEWTIYDALHRKVAYTTKTAGYSKRTFPNTEAVRLLFMDAFEMAAHNLGADKNFHALIVQGKPPPKRHSRHSRLNRPREFSADEPLTLTPPPHSTTPFNQTAPHGRKTAVTIQKNGHGSGFFISKQGHILTNAHVVGNSHLTRVTLADRKQSYIAEILRTDTVRDVALLRLKDPPPAHSITRLPIKTTWPAVGQDIYAIGSPKDHSRLENTVSKGIVSNHRTSLTYDRTRLPYIQGDVAVHGGSSGGPLLDAFGNIVGITVASAKFAEDKLNVGLNLFIPIEDALKALNITLVQPPPP